jgi:S-DNA-T family DNA segregation ATPase FtsK/SpoIIIE
VSDEEVHRVVTHLKAQGSPEYRMEILQASDEDAEDEDPADVDALLNDAQDIVVESRRASISFLQRRLKIGYNRAARIMEQIERRGVVGPPDSRGERQVLV